MTSAVKLHVGNGSVYLMDGWTNIDVWESGAALAKDCPERVDRWGTTEKDYYEKSRFASKAGMVDPSEFVVDRYGSWESMPFETETVDEILSRQCFEHLSKREANYAFMEAWRVLKMGGILRIDVPDHVEAMKQYGDNCVTRATQAGEAAGVEALKKSAFMLRHILGSRKNDFAYHMGSWTREKMIEFAARRGFDFVEEEENIHFYPAFCLRFKKRELDPELNPEFTILQYAAPWQYAGDPLGTPIQVPDDWNCLEVGPGDENRRWPRANAYVDRELGVLDELKGENLACYLCDVTKLQFCFPPEQFDFVLTSHVLEHVEDPLEAARSLAYVSRRGCIIVPSPGKETLFWNHESDHKWTIHLEGDTLYFFPKRPSPLTSDVGASSIMHKLLRLGAPQYGSEGAYMRQAFRRAEPYLDNILYWEGEPNIVVIK